MTEPFIQGIGNEVLIYCGVFLSLVVTVFTFNRYFFNSDEIPHVDGLENVQDRPQRSYNTESCPICLGPHRLAVETNCGHKFCGQCIKTYIDGGGRDHLFSGNILTCPLCRQQINLLLISFSRDISIDETERREIEACVHEFNVRFGNGPRSIMMYIRDCPILIRHLIANFFCYEGIVWVFRLRVVVCFIAALMYLLMPLDIIPEAMFGLFGLLDDIFIVFLCAIYLSIMYRRLLLNRVGPAEL